MTSLACLPQNISSLVVYYNQDLFTAAGVAYPPDSWAWDEFLAMARALTLDTDGDGQVDQYGLGVEPSLYRLAAFIWQNGGPLVDDLARPSRLTVTRFPFAEGDGLVCGLADGAPRRAESGRRGLDG